MERKKASTYTIESLLKGLEVLALFDQNQHTLSLSEIIELTGFGKTNTFRILSTLETANYLERNSETKRYRPSFRAVQLGMSAITGLSLREVAHPYLTQLADQSHEAVGMAILDQLDIVYIERLFPRNIPTVLPGIGVRRPAAITAIGKVLVAHLPPEEQKRWIRDLFASNAGYAGHISKCDLVKELNQIVAQGYGFCPFDEAYAMGSKAVSAPIFNDKSQVVAAVNIAGAEKSISDSQLEEHFLPMVRYTANQISKAFGYSR